MKYRDFKYDIETNLVEKTSIIYYRQWLFQDAGKSMGYNYYIRLKKSKVGGNGLTSKENAGVMGR